jgi:predicted extracellular nuclease
LLDHVLVTPTDGVTTRSASIPHINTSATAAQRRDADTAAGTSDHDPVVVQLALRR